MLVLDDQQSHRRHDATAVQAVTMLSAKGHKDAGRRVGADSDPMTRLASRRLRWLLPAGIAAAIAIASVATTAAASASGQPKLAAKTAAQLLVAVENASPAGLSGTIVETAKLGLPNISGLRWIQWRLGPVARVAGDGLEHDERVVRRQGPAAVRVARATVRRRPHSQRHRLVELRLHTRTVTHKTLTQDQSDKVGLVDRQRCAVADPQAAAEKALAAIDPTTAVVVDRTARVAGRAAYQLQLSPKDSRSLIGSVQIAIDAATSVPLRVQIFAAGASSPAFQVGFTSVSFNVPNSSIFEFVPPAGAQRRARHRPVRRHSEQRPVRRRCCSSSGPKSPAALVAPPGTLVTPAAPATVTPDRKTTELGKGWTAVLKITNAVPALPANVGLTSNGPLPSGGPAVFERAAVFKWTAGHVPAQLATR